MKIIRSCITFAAILGGTGGQADVTAQHVWEKWSDRVSIYGDAFTTGTVVTQGDTLIVPDVTIKAVNGDTTFTSQIGTIKLVENRDGTVTVSLPSRFPVMVVVTPPGDDPSTVNLSVTQDNMNWLVSGDPAAMNLAVSADRFALTIDSIEGKAETEIAVEQASLVMLDLGGSYLISTDSLNRVISEFSWGAVDIDLALTEPGGDTRLNFTADLIDVSAFGDLAAPVDMDLNADVPPFMDGLAIASGYSLGNLATAFSFATSVDAGSGRATLSNANFEMAFDKDGLSYMSKLEDLAVIFDFPNEFPVPIEASLADQGLDLQIPLSQADDGDARDAAVALNMTDLAVTDGLWDLVDPAGVISRDPVTLALDLRAKVTPFFDLLDPTRQQAVVPGEINSLEIADLTIRGLGIDISGTGAFSFDNSDLETFPGLPRPEGEATFAINGVNGLVDSLVNMGLVPLDQAMMPRLFMGMIAVPVGDDQLTSTLEVTDEGHVLANGQRLR